MTSIEMFYNAYFYADHPVFADAREKGSTYSDNPLFILSLSAKTAKNFNRN